MASIINRCSGNRLVSGNGFSRAAEPETALGRSRFPNGSLLGPTLKGASFGTAKKPCPDTKRALVEKLKLVQENVRLFEIGIHQNVDTG